MRSGLAIAMTAYIAVGVMAGCASGTRHSAREMTQMPPSITGVGVEPKTLDLRAAGTATVRYHLSHPARVQMDLVDEDGFIVRRLDAGRQTAGPQALAWDGRANDGRIVASGVYRYVIHAEDVAGRRAEYDPSREIGGEEVVPRDFVFDRATGRLSWVMPKAGRARLRIGLQGFPHLRTLLDWEPLEAGAHEVLWDGLDASGLIHVTAHPNLSVKLSAFALPDNTIVVRAKDAPAPTRSGAPSYPPDHHPGAAYLHARHPRAVCHETAVSLEFPEGTPYDAGGRPILAGTVPVRVRLDARDAAAFVDQRFEVTLYEDLAFLFEEEEGVNPFTFLWDTTRLTPGEHLLTVNVLGYGDHYGLITQPVMIEQRG